MLRLLVVTMMMMMMVMDLVVMLLPALISTPAQCTTRSGSRLCPSSDMDLAGPAATNSQQPLRDNAAVAGPLQIHVCAVSSLQRHAERHEPINDQSTAATPQQCATRLSIYSIQVPEQALSRPPITLAVLVLPEYMP